MRVGVNKACTAAEERLACYEHSIRRTYANTRLRTFRCSRFALGIRQPEKP